MKSRIFTSAAILFSCFNLFAQNGIVATNGKLLVNGNQVTAANVANGDDFSVAGNSFFWSSFENDGGTFYTTEVVNHVVQNWDSQIVRAAIGVEEADGSNIGAYDNNFPRGLVPNPNGSGLYNNYEKELAKAKIIIDAAIANDVYVIVDFHTHFANEFEDVAIRFFREIATEYGDKDNIIYEIFNEPIGTRDNRRYERDDNDDYDPFTGSELTSTWNTIIKPYSINVINAIRAIDPDNLIVVGTPGFSQGVGAAARNPIVDSDLNLGPEADLNIAYTLHFYAGQTEHDALINEAISAMNTGNGNGIALFVTEWGTVAANGDGAVDEAQTKIWMDFLYENNISHANWSITDKPEGASTIQAAKGIEGLLDGELSESGSFVKCIIENWQSNSFENCSPTEVVIVDSEAIPNGQGSKIEVESGLIISPNDELGLDFHGNSGNIETGEYDGEGILVGLGSVAGQWIASTFNGSAQGNYTLQFVVSSDSDGHRIQLQRQFGEENLTGTIEIPNTGGLNNYQIITVPGIPFSSEVFGPDNTAQAISISIQGGSSGSFNMESFYMILDSEFDGDNGGVVDSELVPNGQGAKIEAEAGNINTTYYGNSTDNGDGAIGVDEFDAEGILTNLGAVPVQYSFFGLSPNQFSNGNYTFQFVVSSSSSGNTISSDSNEFTIDVPNTGGLNNYQIVTIQGVSLESGGDNIDISFNFNSGGSGPFNFESVYIIADDEFDETVLNTPTFDADLAGLVNVYPNPVVDFITVDTNEDVEYRVFDLNGSELVTKTEYTGAVNASSLSAGIYFIQLFINEQSQVYKFVKQ